MKAFPLYLVLFCIRVFSSSCDAISCLDEKGSQIEWFIGYKLPDSFHYAYLIPGASDWVRSDMDIRMDGLLKRTFNSAFNLDGSEDSVFGMYNDQPSNSHPNLTNGYWWGHMKGIFAFNGDSGLWIIHSIPHLSTEQFNYVYPETGYIYSQHFLCVSMKRTALSSIVSQLGIARPLFVSYYLSDAVKDKFPQLEQLLKNHKISSDLNATAHFTTSSTGLELLHFSKSKYFGKDLYHDFVAERLQRPLFVETWQHGDPEPSQCDPPARAVMNIQELRFERLQITIRTMQDHAKWAVTKADEAGDKSDHWLCLGDINHELSQNHRGGGTMCIRNKSLWKLFYHLITKYEGCNPSINGAL